MRSFFTLVSVFIVFGFASGQSKLDHHFRSPVDFDVYLSGTFGELRGGHFHAGIDIKTYEQVGKAIKMIEDGYISRIKITRYGYGKAIYVNHPNGYTSVYGHLDGFNRTITKYVEEIQRKQQSYEIDVPVPKDRLYYKKGNIIAYSGNSGYSFGPHIHFEIRETAGQKPVNPLFFGFKVKDNIPPFIRGFKAYNQDTVKELPLQRIKKGKYRLADSDTIEMKGRGYFSVDAIDMLNGAPNRNGVYSYKLFRNGSVVFHWKADRFSFYETRYIHALTDYAEYVESGRKFVWSKLMPNNRLSMYEKTDAKGVFRFPVDSLDSWKWVVDDLKGNKSKLRFYTMGVSTDTMTKIPEGNYRLSPFESETITDSLLTLDFRDNSFYDSVFFDIQSVNLDSVRMGYQIGDNTLPVHRRFTLSADTIPFEQELHQKALWVVFDDEDSVFQAVDSRFSNGKLSASIREFGLYAMKVDTVPPSIKWPVLPDTLRNSRQISIIIKDELSGIDEYDLYLDNEWVIAEYDTKNDVLNYTLPKALKPGNHKLRCVLLDHKGNKTVSSLNFVLDNE